MTKRQIQREEMLVRIKQHLAEHALPPTLVRATTLSTEVDDLLVQHRAAAAAQFGGVGAFRGGSTQRNLLKGQINKTLTKMAATARSLDPDEHAGVRDLFRLDHSHNSYSAIIATASAFIAAVAEPAVKALFTDRGFPATFDTDLSAAVTAFVAATGRKFDGRRDSKEGTVNLKLLGDRITKVVKELRELVTNHLTETDPFLVDVWKAVSRLYAGSDAAAGAPSGTLSPVVPPASGS
jgi:hypothetical protein